jgi:hypothetical protein
VGGPTWPRGVFAVIMLTVAAYCAVRPVAARRRRRMTDLDTDGAHVVTGIAMAGMLTASLRVLPASFWWVVLSGGGRHPAHGWRPP